MEGLTEGRIVHYVMPYGPFAGAPRPAIVVHVWDKEAGTVNLQVFTDGSNDGPNYATGLSWQTSVRYDPDGEVDTWHWIEKA